MRKAWHLGKVVVGSALISSCGGSGGDLGARAPDTGAGGAPFAGGSGFGKGGGAVGGLGGNGASGAPGAGGAVASGGSAGLGGASQGGTSAGGVNGGGAGGAKGGAAGGAGKSGAPMCEGGGAGASGSGATGGKGGASLACTPMEQASAIATMLTQPILPPRFAAGIDLAGGDDWPGLTLAQLEEGYQRVDAVGPTGVYPGAFTRLCKADFFNGLDASFGPNGAVVTPAGGDTSTLLSQIYLGPGYQGSITAKSRDGQHTFVVELGKPITRDGLPYPLSWVNGALPGSMDALVDAMMASFAPAFPPATCQQGQCAAGTSNATPLVHYLQVSRLGLGIQFDIEADASTGSTPSQIQMYNRREVAFSTADVVLKLDAEGAVASTPVGPSSTPCNLSAGMTYADVLSSCVAVTGSAAYDAAETAKLLAQSRRTDDTFELGLPGVNLAFRSTTLDPTDVLVPGALPGAADVVYAIDVDHDATIAGDGPDAAGLVALEYARLVEADLQATRADVCLDPGSCPVGQAPLRTIGDPACLAADQPDDGSPDAIYTQGCTGFEGFVTTAPAIAVSPPGEPHLGDVAYASYAASIADHPTITLRPNVRVALFCAIAAPKGLPEYCSPADGGASGGLFTTSYKRVLAVFAKGDVAKLPPEARDPVFYERRYGRALTKYFVAVAQGQPTFESVHAVPLDLDSEWLVLDPASSHWRFGYVARDLATAASSPTFFEIRGNVDSVSSYRFGRSFRRGETAVYRAMVDHDVAGSTLGGAVGDDVLFSNVFGSHLLRETYAGGALACATQIGVPGCSVSPPLSPSGGLLLDGTGTPILARYAQAIVSGGPLVLGTVDVQLLGQKDGCSSTGPSAYQALRFPQRQTPLSPAPFAGAPTFDTTARRHDALPLVVSDAAGNDLSIGTTALDLGGATFDALVRYDLEGGATKFLGVSSTAFFGAVFLCRDAATNEWLFARATDGADAATAWITSHPKAAKDCGISVSLAASGAVARIASQAGRVQLRYAAPAGQVARVTEVAAWIPAAAP